MTDNQAETPKKRKRGPMPRVTYNGMTYSLTSRNTIVPDFSQMQNMAVLIWLNKHTRARGYQMPTNPLIGFSNVIEVK